MTQKVYVFDLREVKDQFNAIPVDCRRPELVMPGEYSDQECFEMEVEAMLPYLLCGFDAGSSVMAHTESIRDTILDPGNVDEDLHLDNPNVQEAINKELDDYGAALFSLGENLWIEFTNAGMYNHGGWMPLEFDSIIQENLLVLRTVPPEQDQSGHH